MKVAVPQIGTAKPVRIASFNCYTWYMIQVTGPDTAYFSDDQNDLIQTDNPAQPYAGLQVNQASGIVQGWWKGEMWAAGSTSFTFVMVIPGATNTTNAAGGVAA